ncbi:hypothetical protein BJ166DRAFT_24772 [Pestalotiopsis sp. NC0098]|nr:hypothetical protein BJ166DRAFT_24772 [Pestalotiopsis sp. NC0098]
MDVAGLALTSVDLCFKYGSLLVQACNTWKNSEKEVAERIVIFQNAWARTRDQILFVQRIDHTLDDEHRRVLDDTMGVLAAKLSLVASKVQSVQDIKNKNDSKSGFLASVTKIKRGRYVLVKSTLDEVIRDMEDWQRRFDPSWYLILRIASPMIDRTLHQHLQETTAAHWAEISIQATEHQSLDRDVSQRPENAMPQPMTDQNALLTASGVRDALRSHPQRHISIFLPQKELETVEIPYANTVLARRQEKPGSSWLIVNSIPCPPSKDMTVMTKDIRDLARKLIEADPLRFGLLQCKGVMRIMRPSTREIQSFDMVFRAPYDSAIVQCLRDALLRPIKVSLSHRVGIAQQLAKSVNYVHALNFVHKNVRPESVLVWDATESRMPSTFLVGFDTFRSADGGTNLIGDVEWAANIYRHPSRQGERLVESYKIQHDVYSLGVCLLEIGLWAPLVRYDTKEGVAPCPQPGAVFDDYMKENASAPSPSRVNSNLLLSGEPLKKYLVSLAKTELPSLAGDKYAEIVVTCLTCLDQENNGFGDESEMVDEDGILVGVRFIEAILLRLNEIAV